MYLHLFMHEDYGNVISLQTTNAEITIGQLEIMQRHFPSFQFYATEEL